jgi:hypothetical protein
MGREEADASLRLALFPKTHTGELVRHNPIEVEIQLRMDLRYVLVIISDEPNSKLRSIRLYRLDANIRWCHERLLKQVLHLATNPLHLMITLKPGNFVAI